MPKVFRFGKQEKGFTLVEVVAVVSILAIVLIPSFIMFYEGIRYVGTSKLRNQAITLAEEKMEEIRNTAYDNISTTEPNPLEDSKTLGGITFSRDVDVVASPSEISGANNNIKKITATVSWTDAVGNKSVKLVSYRASQL